MADTMELLFFDTFSHESSEELNLDLVQFPDPVYINEVRIIPLGARVQADFPGGVRLGATNPSRFELEFFVNDLSKTGASTFEGLGSLEYKQNVDIQLVFKKKIPTDGLVLRGSYTTVTIAVYGSISKMKERSSPPPPPPPQTTHRIRSTEKEVDTAMSTQPDWDREKPTQTQSVIPETIGYSETHAQTPTQDHAHYPEHPTPAYQDLPTYPEHQQYPDYETCFSEERPWKALPGNETQTPSQHKQESYSKDRASHTRSSYPRDNYDEKQAGWDLKDDRRDNKDPRMSQREDSRERNRDHRERIETSIEYAESDTRDSLDRDHDFHDSSEREDESEKDRLSEREFRSSKKDSGKGDVPRTEGKRPRTPPLSFSPKRRPRTPPIPAEVEQHRSRGPCSPPAPKEEMEPGEVADDKIAAEDLFEPLTPDQSPEPLTDILSDGEIHEGEATDGVYNETVYEEILSEEEYMSEGEERNIDMNDLYYEMTDDSWNYISSFNPYQCDLTPLTYYVDSSLTPYEIEKKKMGCPPDESAMETAQKLLKTLENFQDKDHSEKWVEAMELVPSLLVPGLAILMQGSEFKGIVTTLLEWAVEGLDFEKAIEQSQAVYKVRHMKAGIRLVIALSNCDDEMTKKLLKQNIQMKLLDLFEKEYMALSIKLLIIRALDASTRTKVGIEYLLGIYDDYCTKTVDTLDNKCSSENLSGYQRLLNFLLIKQSTRVAVAISALIRKIHFFEIVCKFTDVVENLIENTPPVENLPDKVEAPKENENELSSSSAVDTEVENIVAPNLSDADVEIIVSSLIEINKILGHAQQLIAQPHRYLPTKSQFETPENPHDAYSGVFNLLRNKKFLESLFIIFSHPSAICQNGIFDIVRDIFMRLMQSQRGLLFMLSQNEIMNGIIRLLTQSADDVRDEAAEESAYHQLGLQLVYHLQVLQYVDALLDFHSKDNSKKELDDPEALAVLQPLYTMVFVPIGRQVVVDVLSIDYNLNALVPFLELTGNEEFDIKIRKSASMGYATELLLIVTHYSENVSLLKNFGEKLLNICTQESSSKLQEVASWFSVTKRIPNYSTDAIASLCNIVKTCLDETLNFPGELISVVRILKDLCISPTIDLSCEEYQEELKYKYAILQFIANDGISNFLTILQKICDAYQYPYQQNYAMIGPQWGLLIALMKPIVSILKHSLSYLIHCRNDEFKDLTAIPIILRVHSFLNILFPSSTFYFAAQTIQAEIIEILLAYTQPVLTVSDSEEALGKSLWTQMLREVLKFITSAPSTFMSGMSIISELLPLPLPFQTREPLSNDEILETINIRKLWSTHLHSLSAEIKDVVVALAGSSYLPLQQQLRRICVQLADLAAPTALVVTRSILDSILENIEGENNNIEEESKLIINSHVCRLLNFLDCLVNQPCIKASFIQLMRASTKIDEKYDLVLPKLTTLLNSPSNKTIHLQIQECILSIFQSLCDCEITICNENLLSPLEQLANALPFKDQLLTICCALIEHVSNMSFSTNTTLLSLRILVMILETDWGFYCVKTCFDKKIDSLRNMLTKCVALFSKENGESVAALNLYLDFVRLLYIDDLPQMVPRTLVLTIQELAYYLQWKTEVESDSNEISSHPLVEIQKTLMDCSRDDDSLEVHCPDVVTNLIQQLNSDSPKMERDIIEPPFPVCESLSAQFSMRVIFVVSDLDDDRLSPTYWLPQTNADDSDQEMERVVCDLDEMAEQYCPSLDLKTELGKDSVTKDGSAPFKCKKKGNNQSSTLGKRKYQPLINPGQKERSGKKPFIAPMRGRGFSRGGIHPSRANDPFRSRPPNTSRPPSMHVDDFVALETFHPSAVPTGPTNKRPNKEPGRGRGRGSFDSSRGFLSTRGRFFTTQNSGSSYSTRRGDDKSARGIGRGTSRGSSSNLNIWNSRSGPLLSLKNIQKSNPSIPRSFSRGGSHLESRTEIRSVPGSNRSQEIYGTRFSRGRGVGNSNTSGGNSSSGNWSGSRTKERDARFSVSGGTSSRGRRDANRHVRALTR